MLPQQPAACSNVLQATDFTCAYATRTVMDSWLLVYVGMGGHTVENTFVLCESNRFLVASSSGMKVFIKKLVYPPELKIVV
jgi:hypothetical protein